jgi:thioredoxin 1
MKKRTIELVIIYFLFIILVSACGGSSTQTTPSSTPTIPETVNAPVTREIPLPSNTPGPQIDNSPEPISTLLTPSDIPVVTDIQNPFPQPSENSIVQGNTQNPYPQPIINTSIAGNGQEPYPQPIQFTPVSGNGQTPYPDPNEPPSNTTQNPSTTTTQLPPGSHVLPTSTQAIALNPIQSPVPSSTATFEATNDATSTTIVSTGLKASDPTKVKLASGNYQLIEFFAFWCPICKSMAPIMNGLQGKYQGRLALIYLDIDDPLNKPFKEALGYRYQPHTFLLDGDGKIIQQWVGFVTVEEFETVLAPIFP